MATRKIFTHYLITLFFVVSEKIKSLDETSINQNIYYIIYLCFKTITNVTFVKNELMLNYNP